MVQVKFTRSIDVGEDEENQENNKRWSAFKGTQEANDQAFCLLWSESVGALVSAHTEWNATRHYEPGGNVQSAYWPGVFEAGATKVNTGTLCVRHTPQMKRFGDCLELSGDLVRPE